MAQDDLKPATLQPANDATLSATMTELIESTHPGLKDAKIYVLWALGRPLSFWGRIEIASEKLWWLSGGLEGEGADIVLQLNQSLWDHHLTILGQKFVLDHYLSTVRKKTGGVTQMETVEGIRALYEKEEGTLKLNPAVCARHPKGLREIDEVKRLWIALAKPAQFQLTFPDGEEGEKGEQEGDGVAGEKKIKGRKPAREVAPPIFYDEKRMFSELGPAAVRYTEADLRPETAVGIHFFTDATAARDAGDLAALEYDMRPEAMRPVREALEQEHDAWVAAGNPTPTVEEPAYVAR